VIEVQRTDYLSVGTRDLQRAARFYGETLGLPRNPLAPESYPEFETGNLTITLLASEGADADFRPSPTAIALRVPDVAEARAALEVAGVDFRGETFDTGVCHIAFFADPDGNALALHRRYAPYSDGSTP
jgi:predicted enzyme related to lactoylglutathione lyase